MVSAVHVAILLDVAVSVLSDLAYSMADKVRCLSCISAKFRLRTKGLRVRYQGGPALEALVKLCQVVAREHGFTRSAVGTPGVSRSGS